MVLAVGQTENTCTVRATMWATYYMDGSSKKQKFSTQSMPRSRRDTVGAAKKDTVQVVENERPCTWYTHQVGDVVTRFLMKTMQERAVKSEKGC